MLRNSVNGGGETVDYLPNWVTYLYLRQWIMFNVYKTHPHHFDHLQFILKTARLAFSLFPDFIRLYNTMTTTTTPTYQELAAKKRADQLSQIPREWRLATIPSIKSTPNALAYIRRILTPAELALTEETDINILLRRLSSKEITSLELTRAFAKRAALAHQLTTCCTEIFFEDAFSTATQLDGYLAQTGKTVGPLHGLPVSIKDLFSVKGVDTSIGIHPSSPPRSKLTIR